MKHHRPTSDAVNRILQNIGEGYLAPPTLQREAFLQYAVALYEYQVALEVME